MDSYPNEGEDFLAALTKKRLSKGPWGEAIKSKLGTVWHKEGIAGKAHCDYRIRLNTVGLRDAPPADEYVCKRCQKF